mmetsp:Transcript_35343/g.81926  ORF Transcript_35343/g.81926 Transcript_35343/m.81926 type:complete len:218 (+) Transcript_35343:2683-3336(+)
MLLLRFVSVLRSVFGVTEPSSFGNFFSESPVGDLQLHRKLHAAADVIFRPYVKPSHDAATGGIPLSVGPDDETQEGKIHLSDVPAGGVELLVIVLVFDVRHRGIRLKGGMVVVPSQQLHALLHDGVADVDLRHRVHFHVGVARVAAFGGFAGKGGLNEGAAFFLVPASSQEPDNLTIHQMGVHLAHETHVRTDPHGEGLHGRGSALPDGVLPKGGRF